MITNHQSKLLLAAQETKNILSIKLEIIFQ